MDLEFLNDIKKAKQFEVPVTPVKYCPKCDSPNFENRVCEACSYHRPEHLLGEPLGPKSFYSLKEYYLNSLNMFERNNISILRDTLKHKRFVNKAKYRYNDLLDYFYDEFSIEDPSRNVFLQELTDIVVFFIDEGVSEEEIWMPLSHLEVEGDLAMSSLYLKIKEAIDFAGLEAVKSKSFFASIFLNERFGRFSTFLLILMFIIGFSYFWIRFDIGQFN